MTTSSHKLVPPRVMGTCALINHTDCKRLLKTPYFSVAFGGGFLLLDYWTTPLCWSLSRHWKWWLDSVKVLCPTRHQVGHFRDVAQANLLPWYGKTKPNTTKARIHQSKEMYYNTKINTKKLKLGLVTSYDIWPGNRQGLAYFAASYIWHFVTNLDNYALT